VIALRVGGLVLLAALSAQAELPAMHVSVGLGLSASRPLGARQSRVWNPPFSGEGSFPLQADCAVSGELGFETTHVLVGISFEHGGTLNSQPSFDLIALRGGAIFGSGSVGPYVALGGGALWMDVWTPYDMGERVHASGGAVLAEAGVMFLRDRQFGRIALALRFIEPLFGMHPPFWLPGIASTSDRIPLLLFTTRVSL